MKGRARRDRREKGDEDCAWVAMAHAGVVEENATGVEDVGRTAGALLDGELVEGDGEHHLSVALSPRDGCHLFVTEAK